MEPRFDGYYLSGRQRSEDWHAGVCMVREYFRYLKLFQHGLWLLKDHPTPDLDFVGYLSGLPPQALEEGLAGRDPLDQEYEFVHQTGTFTLTGDRLVFVSRYFLIIMHERRWVLRVASSERLVSESDAVYVFCPASQAEQGSN